jgi:hypothetical protein
MGSLLSCNLISAQSFTPTPNLTIALETLISGAWTQTAVSVIPSQTATANAPTNTLEPKLITETHIPTETLLPTETAVPTVVLSPEEALIKLSKDDFKDDLIDAKIGDVFGMKYAMVDYDLGSQWSENAAITNANVTFVMFAPKVFEIEGIDALELRFFTMFKDVYGNENQDFAMKYTIMRELSNKINWNGISWREVGSILNLEGNGNGVYVHPSLESAWREYISGQ